MGAGWMVGEQQDFALIKVSRNSPSLNPSEGRGEESMSREVGAAPEAEGAEDEDEAGGHFG